MVNAITGVIISCDAAMAEFIVKLNDTVPGPERFIVERFDDTHMMVLPHAAGIIRREVAEFSKRNPELTRKQLRKIVKSNLYIQDAWHDDDSSISSSSSSSSSSISTS